MGIWRSPLHRMFHLREHSLSWNDKVNAGAKPQSVCQPVCEQGVCYVLCVGCLVISSLVSQFVILELASVQRGRLIFCLGSKILSQGVCFR